MFKYLNLWIMSFLLFFLGACSGSSIPIEGKQTVEELVFNPLPTETGIVVSPEKQTTLTEVFVEVAEPVREPTTEAVAIEEAPSNVDAPVGIEAQVSSECLDCHTDKERLIDNAKPEEEVVSENEGEG